MHHVIRLFEALLGLLLPATGRHRPADVPPPPAVRADVPPVTWARVPARHSEVLRGEDSALVRPYLVAYERQRCDRPECVRLRRMHDMEVAA